VAVDTGNPFLSGQVFGFKGYLILHGSVGVDED
jgi:hypothetical protein